MARFWEVLQIGFFSMFYAEVLTASSVLWFLDPFAWIVTLPLYMFHTLILLNIAKKLKLSKISQYYLLGTIFGLYEGWITKVLWSGYPSERARNPILGEVGEIAIFEFSILVFFYHSIFSFILPIITYNYLHQAYGGSDSFPIYINISGKSKALMILSFFFATSTLVFNNGYNFPLILLSLLGSIFLMLVVNLKIRTLENPYSPNFLMLKSKGISIVGVYLLLLYVVTFILFSPEYLPGPLGYGIVILFYIIPATVLLTPREETAETYGIPITEVITSKMLRTLLVGFSFAIIIFLIIPLINVIVLIAIQILFFIISPILYILMIRSAN